MPFSGDVNRTLDASRAVDGSVSFTGNVGTFSQIKANVAGALGLLTGAVTSRLPFKKRDVFGNISFSGALGSLTQFKQAVTGQLSFASELFIRSPFRRVSLAGVLSFFGSLASSGGQVISGLFRPLFSGKLFNKLFKGN